MNPRTKQSLLWGVVGLLSFLVLLQAYELITDTRVDLLVKAGAALLVGVGATLATHWASTRVPDAEHAEQGPTEDESP